MFQWVTWIYQAYNDYQLKCHHQYFFDLNSLHGGLRYIADFIFHINVVFVISNYHGVPHDIDHMINILI